MDEWLCGPNGHACQGDNNRVGDAIIIDRVAIFPSHLRQVRAQIWRAKHVASEQRLYGTMT